MYRCRFDMYVNLCQHKVRRKRSRAVSRIPITQIKRVLHKSKKVIIKVQKHAEEVVPQSSKLYPYLSRKNRVYHRLNNELCGMFDHQLESRTSKDYQSR